MILVNDDASGASWGEVFFSSFCVSTMGIVTQYTCSHYIGNEYTMLGMWIGSIGKFMSWFKRQSSSLESCGWKIHLCVFKGSFVVWNYIYIVSSNYEMFVG